MISLLKKMKNEVEKEFLVKRLEGESEDYLCWVIQINKIDEFVTFVGQTNLSVESEIKNRFLKQINFLKWFKEIFLIDKKVSKFYISGNDITDETKRKIIPSQV